MRPTANSDYNKSIRRACPPDTLYVNCIRIETKNVTLPLLDGGVTFFAPAAARSTLDRRIYHAKNKMGIYRFYGQFIPYYLTVYCPHGAAGAAASGRPAGAGGIPDALPPCGWYDGVGLLLRDAPMCAGHAAPGSARSRGSCRSSHRAFAAAGCSAPPRRHTGRDMTCIQIISRFDSRKTGYALRALMRSSATFLPS